MLHVFEVQSAAKLSNYNSQNYKIPEHKALKQKLSSVERVEMSRLICFDVVTRRDRRFYYSGILQFSLWGWTSLADCTKLPILPIQINEIKLSFVFNTIILYSRLGYRSVAPIYKSIKSFLLDIYLKICYIIAIIFMYLFYCLPTT